MKTAEIKKWEYLCRRFRAAREKLGQAMSEEDNIFKECREALGITYVDFVDRGKIESSLKNRLADAYLQESNNENR